MYPESRSFESNKILGGVGALLAALGSFIPFSASIGIVYIIGTILVLISMRGLSEDFKENAVYRNSLNGFIFGVIGAAIGILLFAVAPITAVIVPGRPLLTVFNVFLALGASVLVFAFLVFASIFFRRAFEILAMKSGEKMFRTGGLLLLIGAVLIIAFGLGFVLLFVAWILLAVGFFSMRPPVQPENIQAPTPVVPAVPSSQLETVKFCQYCGAENKLEATFCTHCGRKIA